MRLKVEKAKMEAVLYTQQLRIEGEVYILEGERFTDFMNAEPRFQTRHDFMPVTNSKVYSLSEDRLLYETSFLNVNKDFVVVASPKNLVDV
jgi:hypothetical protein